MPLSLQHPRRNIIAIFFKIKEKTVKYRLVDKRNNDSRGSFHVRRTKSIEKLIEKKRAKSWSAQENSRVELC